ncbi:MAG: hypothetical protein WDM87_06655 [Terracidiphilus sp.]
MQAQPHPLEPFFQQIVRNSYEGKLGLHDPDVTAYVARILCDFSQSDKLYSIRDAEGRPIEHLEEMERAADPVHGSGHLHLDAERALRKYIGDYSLFVAGMYPEATAPAALTAAIIPVRVRVPTRVSTELIRVGKHSYFIVSQFNLFEYEQEAPLFARLSSEF